MHPRYIYRNSKNFEISNCPQKISTTEKVVRNPTTEKLRKMLIGVQEDNHEKYVSSWFLRDYQGR